jgi:hypothetical protein
MMIASARLVSLIACIPLLGGLAIRAQVAAGTHANLYGVALAFALSVYPVVGAFSIVQL